MLFSRPEFLAELLDVLLSRNANWQAPPGGYADTVQRPFAELLGPSEALKPKLVSGEQSNSSVIYGERFILKFFRRIEEGENPDLEIGKIFCQNNRVLRTLRGLAGWVEYQLGEGQAATQAILQEFVPNQGRPPGATLEEPLTAFYDKVGGATEPEVSTSQERAEFADESIAKLLAEIGLLGKAHRRSCISR